MEETEKKSADEYIVLDVPPDRYIARLQWANHDVAKQYVVDKVVRVLENNIQASLPDGPMQKVEMVYRDLVPDLGADDGASSMAIQMSIPYDKVRWSSEPLSSETVAWVYEKAAIDRREQVKSAERLAHAIEASRTEAEVREKMIKEIQKRQASGIALPPGVQEKMMHDLAQSGRQGR